MTALHSAVLNENIDMVKFLLSFPQIDVNLTANYINERQDEILNCNVLWNS